MPLQTRNAFKLSNLLDSVKSRLKRRFDSIRTEIREFIILITLNSCEVLHGVKKLELDFSQALRLLQESQFLKLNTWLVSLFILYNTISAIVLDPEKNRVFIDHSARV
jgi:hypothetical protein